MIHTPSHNEIYRYGHAGFADMRDFVRARLFDDDNGVFIGFYGGRPVFVGGDAPLTTVAGSGAGKGRDIILYNTCLYKHHLLCLDPKGELAAISYRAQVALKGRERVYLINHKRLHGMAAHRLNPLDILARNDHLASDAKMFAQNLIPQTRTEDGYWEQSAARWVEALLVWLTHEHGSVTFPMLWQAIGDIMNDDAINRMVLRMTNYCPYPIAGRTASEIHTMRYATDSKQFQIIYATLQNHLGWLDDHVMLDYLATPDFSLKVITEPQPCAIFIMIPAELLGGVLSGFVRCLFTAAFLYKLRAVGSPPALFLVDEAAQLRKFQTLIDLYSYGRGMGLRTWAFWQSTEQMCRLYGSTGEFLASSQVRSFFGLRDLETTKMCSAMLGTETLEYDHEEAQLQAKHAQYKALQDFWTGGANPFQAFHDAMYYKTLSQIKTKQARELRTPAEILQQPENEQYAFLSGMDIAPLLLQRYPYYSRQARKLMKGRFDPSPYHR